jgi:hypothetical protein
MTNLYASQIPWRKPWGPVAPERARPIEAELHREICPGHVLFGKRVSAVGQRQDQDHFLFVLHDGNNLLARVHLTFHKETNPAWPHTDLYESVSVWLRKDLRSM